MGAPRVIVMGAGPGGLATAMLLARAEMSVQVLERQPFLGGRTSPIEFVTTFQAASTL